MIFIPALSLLAPPVLTVSNLMDNQFIALKATDDQEAAVKVFEQERRTGIARDGFYRSADSEL